VQFFIRPVDRFEGFSDQVRGLVETAADYGARLVVFPEYLTTQLLTLGDVRRPIDQQIRDLSQYVDDYIGPFSALSARFGIYICAGTIPVADPGDRDIVYNDSFLFGPDGEYGVQGKLHMTRWESDEWRVSTRDRLRLFDTELGRLAVAICYDSEFPEIARAAARQGARILVVPSCTDERAAWAMVARLVPHDERTPRRGRLFLLTR
jgi:predicted amidohydrolase